MRPQVFHAPGRDVEKDAREGIPTTIKTVDKYLELR
jgi:hypothetical protein